MPSEKTSLTAISWSSFSILVNVIGRLVSLVVAKTLIFPLVTFFYTFNHLKNTPVGTDFCFWKKDKYF